jgi:hypothetical protein
MENSILQQTIVQLKAAGYSPQDVMKQLKSADQSVMSVKGFDPTAFGGLSMVEKAASLTNAIAFAFEDELTPLLLAQLLKIYDDDILFVARGIMSPDGYPETSAFDLGKLLLDPTLYPNTGKTDMYNVLVADGVGFSPEVATDAVNRLYAAPVSFTVQGNQSWQNTGVTVGSSTVTITYQGGEWLCSPMGGMVTAAGNPSFIGKPGYALQGAPEGALVGRVGDNGVPFLVGVHATVPVGQSGPLQVVMNDDLGQRYGLGLSDNYGSVVVSIVTG